MEKGLEPDPIPAADYFVETGVRTVVVDVDGISVIDTGNDVPRDFSTRPEIATALNGERTTGTRYSETLGTELLYVAVPVASGGVVHGALRLTIDTHEVTERVQTFWIGLVVVGVIILVVMAGIGALIARSVTRPVRRLQAEAERFASGDLTPSVSNEPSPPELAALEASMQEMARRLDDLIERQRAFVADASHQLRTPLTALRLRLENLETDVTEPTSAASWMPPSTRRHASPRWSRTCCNSLAPSSGSEIAAVDLAAIVAGPRRHMDRDGRTRTTFGSTHRFRRSRCS